MSAINKKNNTNSDKAKALTVALGQIDRQFGKGAIMRLGERDQSMRIEEISTGSLSLDMALGIGGIPKGRVTEVYGTESSGKSTLAYHIMAEAQKAGGQAAYIDAEHALDPSYAARCAVDINELLVSQPDNAEQALEISEYLVRSGAIDVVVVDSVAALVPKSELEGDMGDSHVGLQARLMSQALRKLTAAISRSNTAFVFINQVREKVGVLWGNPEVTPGRTSSEILQFGENRPAPHRVNQAGPGDRGQPRPRQGCKEQGCAPVPCGRVRHHVQRGNQLRGRPAGAWRRKQRRHKERRLLLVRGHPPGTGQGELKGFPSGSTPDIAGRIEAMIRETLMPEPAPPAPVEAAVAE